MKSPLDELTPLRDQHDVAGKKLFEISGGRIFPCHALYLSVLGRSLELFDSFVLLQKSGHYCTSMAILRLQLDNVLRFYGVLITNDPHRTANEIFTGIKLKNIKDKSGKKLSDVYLVETMSLTNPWVKDVYNVCCDYIHLSDQHMHQMLNRTTIENDGERKFHLGSDDSHIKQQYKTELISAFRNVTNGIFQLLLTWENLSQNYDTKKLVATYAVCVKQV